MQCDLSKMMMLSISTLEVRLYQKNCVRFRKKMMDRLLQANELSFHSSSFLRYVTSGSGKKVSLKFKKCVISNKSILNGRPGRYRKSQMNTKKNKKTSHTQPERDHTAIEVSPKSSSGAISSEDVPANSRTRKNGPKMKKHRSLHDLHVPPRKSMTR